MQSGALEWLVQRTGNEPLVPLTKKHIHALVLQQKNITSQVASYTSTTHTFALAVAEVGRNNPCQSLLASAGIEIPAETREKRVKLIQIT